MTTNKAEEWVRTDPVSVLNDINRLGFDAAVDYNMQLARERCELGDHRWDYVTADEMADAMSDLELNDDELESRGL